MGLVRRTQVPTVPVAQVSEVAVVEGELLVVDVREPAEWDAGHIPGALHIPMGEVQVRVGEVPRDRDIVVVCRSGARSAAVTRFLADGGWRVRNLGDGMAGWAALGRPMVSETGAPPSVI